MIRKGKEKQRKIGWAGDTRRSNHLIKIPKVNTARAAKAPSRSRNKVNAQVQANKKEETHSRSYPNSTLCHVEMVNFLEDTEHFSLYPS